MTEQANPDQDRTSGLAFGLVVFAGVLMVMIGICMAIVGFSTIVEIEGAEAAPNYPYEIDLTTLGWIYLVFGVIIAVAGCYVLRGVLWARAVGIVLAVLSALMNFLFIPYQPLWSILIMTLDAFIIWALCVTGAREVEGMH